MLHTMLLEGKYINNYVTCLLQLQTSQKLYNYNIINNGKINYII